jgi:hypothetical protein
VVSGVQWGAPMKRFFLLLSLLGAEAYAQTATDAISTPPPQQRESWKLTPGDLPTHLLLNLDAKVTQFKPFTKDDFFSEDYNLYDYVLIPKLGRVEPITVKEFLDRLNRSENLLAQIGRSLRNNDPSILVNALANPEIFYRQLANELNLSQEALLQGAQDSLEVCPLLKAEQLAGDLDKRVDIKGGLNVKIRDLIPQLNQQQKLFCSLGYTMLQDDINDLGALVSEVLPRRAEIMQYLDLDENHRLVQIAQWAQTLNPEEIKAQIKEIQEAIRNPTPELIYNLAQMGTGAIDPVLQLPDIPRVEAPQLVKRTDLKLKKRYNWKGVHEGDPKIAQVNIDAWAELRAGKSADAPSDFDTEQAFQAEGKGGFVFLSNPVDVFVAQLDSSIAPKKAKAEVTSCLLRACVKKVLLDKEAKDWQYGDKILDESWDFPYAQQFFIGPIPVVLRAMVVASAYADWDLAFTLVTIDGGVKGKVKAVAAAEGAVGLKDFVEAGAGGQMTIVENTTTLRGGALIASSDSGAPFITGNLVGSNEIRSLDGSIYGYAMIDVMGPLGEYLEDIVQGIKDLGEAGQKLINYLDSVGSDLGKKLARKVGNEISKAGKNIGKVLTGKKKLFKKSATAGVGYGLSVNGTKIRYQQDLITWPGYSNNHRFLNYKIFIGSDGKEYGGDIAAFSPEQMKGIEEEVDLKIREQKVAMEEARIDRDFVMFFETAAGYLQASETQNVPATNSALTNAFGVLERDRMQALRKLREVVGQ